MSRYEKGTDGRPERILVTNGGGFVGSHVVEYYANRGKAVTALDNLGRIETLDADEVRDRATYNWRYLAQRFSASIDLVVGDVRNFDTLRSLVEDHDAIVHTAGQVTITSSIEDPGRTSK